MVLSMNFQKRVRVAPDVLFRAFNDEAILLNLKTETYFELDDVGTSMWQQVTGSGTLQEAYDALLHQYEVEPARLREDMVDLLGQLLENGLLVLRDE